MHNEARNKAIHAKMGGKDKDGFDGNKRWGNSAIKGIGVNSPAMMEARKKMVKVSHKGSIGHVVESIGAGGHVTSVKKSGTKEQLKKLGY